MKANKLIGKFVRTLDILDQKGERIPGLILSHAGFGKTSTIKMYCKMMDYNLETIIPSQNAADDILGIQSVDPKTGILKRLTPSWYNKLVKTMENGKRTILFIDEISTCDSYIQGPLLNLIFERSLGEEKLPDNVFIIAAGNYSADLNNEFKMTAPLVNRFLLLNLMPSDFNIQEILNDTFGQTISSTPADIEKFLDVKEESKDKLYYDYNSFKDWIKSSKEIGFSRTDYIESCGDEKDYGIIGFTSVRSLSYSLKFTEVFMSMYSDDVWTRIVGDTLGTSNRRRHENDVVFLRDVLVSREDSFMKGRSENVEESLANICKRLSSAGDISPADLKEVKEIIMSTPASDFTKEDITEFSEMASKLWYIPGMTDIVEGFTNKIQNN